MEESYQITDQGEPEEIKDLGKRFDLAVRKHRLTKELHEKLVEQGQITEQLMREMEQENQSLTNRIKELKEQTEKEKKFFEKNEILQQKDLAEKKMKIRQMENQLEELKEENQQLAAELEDRVKNHQEETTPEMEIKEKHQKILEGLQNKDAQIESLSKIESERKMEIEGHAKIIEELREELHLLEKHLSDIQEEQILTVLKCEPDTEALHLVEEDDEEEEGDDDDVDKDDFSSVDSEECWWRYGAMILQGGAMAAGYAILAFFLTALIMAFLTTTCSTPDPSCSLWMVAFELLEPYGELSHSVSPVF